MKLPHELVFAARVLRKNRSFTLVATASLALAIGANTTIFSVARQLLFERLDVADAASLRLIASTAATDANLSYPIYERLRAGNEVLDDLLAFHVTAVNATVGDDAERALIHEVSGRTVRARSPNSDRSGITCRAPIAITSPRTK